MDRSKRSTPEERRLTQATLYALMEAVRHHESISSRPARVHGCALAAPTVMRAGS